MRDPNGARRSRPALPALAVVLALAVGAVVVDRTVERPTSRTAGTPTPTAVDGPLLPDRGSLAVAWFCAEGTSTADGRASETILVGNLSTNAIDATVTVVSDGAEASSRVVSVDPLAQRRIPVAEIAGPLAEPGVVVEIRGGEAVVEHELRGQSDVAVNPCARRPSSRWYFAAGTTQRGAEEWLALFNPFGDDAIVDITVLTDSGALSPPPLQSLTIPRRSRLSVPVHEHVLRRDATAVSIVARTGRIVAERTLRFDGTEGRRGLAVSLGVTDPAAHWRLPFGDARSGEAQSVALANFDAIATSGTVTVTLDGGIALPPRTVEVPAHSVVRVNVSEDLAPGRGYVVDVRVTRRTPLVVESVTTWSAVTFPGVNGAVSGLATSPGIVTVAREWAFALSRADSGDALFAVVNASDQPATVELRVYVAGDRDSPRSAPAVALAPGERTYFSLVELGLGAGQVVRIVADRDVVASRTLLTPGTGTSSSASTTTTTLGSGSSGSSAPGASVSSGVPAVR